MDGEAVRGDYFFRARSIACAGLISAGAAAVIGSLLDWVTIEPPPTVPDDQLAGIHPFSGIDVRDGWWTLALGVALIVLAVLLFVRRRSGFAWLAFLSSMVMGAIAIADYRAIVGFEPGGVADEALFRRAEIIGEADPAIGITLVAAAALVGFVSSLVGVASTPNTG